MISEKSLGRYWSWSNNFVCYDVIEWQTDGRSISKTLEMSFLLPIMNTINFPQGEAGRWRWNAKKKYLLFGTVFGSSTPLHALECSLSCGFKCLLCGYQEKAIIFPGEASFPSRQENKAGSLPHLISIHAVYCKSSTGKDISELWNMQTFCLCPCPLKLV